MANKEDHENAAKIPPSKRTPAEQSLVTEGVSVGIGNTRNIDHEARHLEKYPSK